MDFLLCKLDVYLFFNWFYRDTCIKHINLPIQKIHVKEICFIHKTKHYQLQKLLKSPTMLLYSLSLVKKKKKKPEILLIQTQSFMILILNV